MNRFQKMFAQIRDLFQDLLSGVRKNVPLPLYRQHKKSRESTLVIGKVKVLEIDKFSAKQAARRVFVSGHIPLHRRVRGKGDK